MLVNADPSTITFQFYARIGQLIDTYSLLGSTPTPTTC